MSFKIAWYGILAQTITLDNKMPLSTESINSLLFLVTSMGYVHGLLVCGPSLNITEIRH